MFEGRYAEAADLIDRIPEIGAKAGNLPRSGLSPFDRGRYAQTKGIIFRATADMEEARTAFAQSRQGFAKYVAEPSAEELVPNAKAGIAVADVGLGRKEEALREIAELDEVQTDPNVKSPPRIAVAVVYAWTGKTDEAIRALQKIVKVNGHLTRGDLKFNPKWNGLRSDPRFAAIVADAGKPVRIE